MSRVLLLGSRGRLGAALQRMWSPRHEVAGLARTDVDVSDPAALERTLGAHRFDVLINCTAQTNVDRCESERNEAEIVNVQAPGLMARIAEDRGARLVHFSTDYVFDGTKSDPYVEDDKTNPLSHYGMTKREGERAVLAAGGRHVVARVSWVFGPDKPSFLDMILDRALREDRVEAIADKVSSPTLATDVAEWIEPFFDPGLPGGIYHACNGGSCSWRDWGEHGLRCAREAGGAVRTTTVEPLALSEMKMFVAARPRNTPLATGQISRTTGLTPRPWQDAVEDYIRQKFSK